MLFSKIPLCQVVGKTEDQEAAGLILQNLKFAQA